METRRPDAMEFRNPAPQLNKNRLSLCALALAALLGCRGSRPPGQPPSLQPLNVAVITIDTLRADRLGCYGYSNIATPHLDRLASRGALFENAVAQAPLTSPSHASIFTALYPPAHTVRDTGNFVLPPGAVTIAEILQQAGWDTAAFVGASVLKKRFGFGQGFAIYDDRMPPSAAAAESPERRAAEVVDRAAAWLGARSGKPFFLWVHVFDPHHPYDPPPPFRERYKERPYDGEIAYTDEQIGRLLEALSRKAPGKTVIAVLSDHGESFSEHGEYTHGIFLYDTTVRIPLILAGPGVPSGLRVRSQARAVDLMPTLLDLLSGQAPAGVQGVSLKPALAGRQASAADTAYIETLFPRINMGWAELRGIRTGRWKYIRAPKPELYDLVRDPAETANVIDSHPAERRQLEAALAAAAGGTEQVEPVTVDPRTLEQLRSLGYLGGSARQTYTLTGEGIDPKDRLDVLRLLHVAMYADPDLPSPKQAAALRQALDRDPSNPSLYSHLGDVLRAAGRSGEEVKLYQEAANRGIRSAWLYSRLGALLLRQGRKQEAIAALEGAARANPSDYASMQNLAVAYRETGRIADAERVLRAILEGEEYAPAYNELGMTAYQKGDMRSALRHFEKAAGLDPAYHLNLARLYRMAGDNPRARASFEAFLRAAEANPEHRGLIPQARRELAALD